ncbi:hypothetical protein OH708_00490 [Pseudomonas capsici]|uniref:hypothetical protein n=1 Tax=Pseudomonas capsici TaxID=2810614 RepID=UPI000E3B6252|nr:hypothetical protein [Pseudomonas capsici]MBX8475542.1 hypothetical protein [Pseudomonas cichorii]MBX8607348.1 hypothetical protein [Pseudomonas cichorii]MBX8611141.1 hypothetical protein [Pseudomonas cichorii]MCV4272725.1 hypothetical protein [Pseudomonas capsici]MCV4286373.1 hypothetical protein [Pseudomonas capsici]
MKIQACLLGLLIPVCSAHAIEKAIVVPSDPTGNYALVEKSGNAGKRVVVTKREGFLGVMYSKRVYDCQNRTVNLVGTGATLEIMEQSHPVSSMGPIIRDSTAEDIHAEACS